MSDFIIGFCIVGAACVVGLVLGHEAKELIQPLLAILAGK